MIKGFFIGKITLENDVKLVSLSALWKLPGREGQPETVEYLEWSDIHAYQWAIEVG